MEAHTNSIRARCGGSQFLLSDLGRNFDQVGSDAIYIHVAQAQQTCITQVKTIATSISFLYLFCDEDEDQKKNIHLYVK